MTATMTTTAAMLRGNVAASPTARCPVGSEINNLAASVCCRRSVRYIARRVGTIQHLQSGTGYAGRLPDWPDSGGHGVHAGADSDLRGGVPIRHAARDGVSISGEGLA
jgi:hypothetical protein